ncbi:hypothetical protein LZG04_16305 [Saccharothrix sp. S26]|uniref:AfsA-related hotdog domain-containing protein n=1 Tax=Saccharothrix sp. S26 TaxID=2907215 RepID=UPI001F3E5C27|nr:AfsA-related hotdog domain-containing protein [Saccharothrix sp. S26]MCE6996348.1 hypothetical protein [Saccharothrix sp. S26]
MAIPLSAAGAGVVDLSLVHRSSTEEVFLRSARRTGLDRHVGAVRLPRRHRYFNDHPDPRTDPLLLLECCRQFGSYLAHTAYDVPMDTAFLVKGWSVATADVPPSDPDVEIEAEVADRVMRGGNLRAANLRMRMTSQGRWLADITIAVGYAGPEEYRALRALQHGGGTVPNSDDLPGATRADQLDAAAAGRTHQDNSLLAGVRRTDTGGYAELSVDPRHPTLFGHSNDHFTALTLTDAARQLAIATGGHAEPPALAGFDCSFSRFAELDQPVLLTSTAEGDSEVRVVVRQRGRQVADISLAFAPAASRHQPLEV